MTNQSSDISKICIQIILKEPFYGQFLLGVPKIFSEKIETAAVCLLGNNLIQLLLNSKFWNSLSEDHQYGLIKHEVLHIVLKHLFRSPDFPNKRVFNIAADLVVNQYIASHQLPDGGLVIDRFRYLEPNLGFTIESDKDTGYYYRMLMTEIQKGLSKSDYPNYSETDSATGDIWIGDILSEDLEAIEKHKFWGEIEKLPKAEKLILESNVNNNIKNTWNRIKLKSKNYGNLPAGLIDKIEALLGAMKPAVDWKRVLGLFGANSNSSYIKNTIRRPSKRYGTTPGIKIKRRNKLLIAIDTSASVNNEELAIFFAEIYHIWKKGAEITIVECDTVIHKTYSYKGIPPNEIVGRGGTDFNAPLKYANKEVRPDAIIYFTDGYAGKPEVKTLCPILWLISKNGLSEIDWGFLPGRKVKMAY